MDKFVIFNMAKVTAKKIKDALAMGDGIIMWCVECDEITYPNAYNTADVDETVRICNGCGKVWEIK